MTESERDPWGTPGRSLIDGAKKIQFAGEEIIVQAKIHTLGGFSAHASQSQLIDWLSYFAAPKPRLYLVHGENNAKTVLESKVKALGWQVSIPKRGDTISF